MAEAEAASSSFSVVRLGAGMSRRGVLSRGGGVVSCEDGCEDLWGLLLLAEDSEPLAGSWTLEKSSRSDQGMAGKEEEEFCHFEQSTFTKSFRCVPII